MTIPAPKKLYTPYCLSGVMKLYTSYCLSGVMREGLQSSVSNLLCTSQLLWAFAYVLETRPRCGNNIECKYIRGTSDNVFSRLSKTGHFGNKRTEWWCKRLHHTNAQPPPPLLQFWVNQIDLIMTHTWPPPSHKPLTRYSQSLRKQRFILK